MKNPTFSLWCKRLTWLVSLWLLSVAALGIFAFLLRYFMAAIGMATP